MVVALILVMAALDFKWDNLRIHNWLKVNLINFSKHRWDHLTLRHQFKIHNQLLEWVPMVDSKINK